MRVLIAGFRCPVEQIVEAAQQAGFEIVRAASVNFVVNPTQFEGFMADLAIIVQEGGAIINPYSQKMEGTKKLTEYFEKRGIQPWVNGHDAMLQLLGRFARWREVSITTAVAVETNYATHRLLFSAGIEDG